MEAIWDLCYATSATRFSISFSITIRLSSIQNSYSPILDHGDRSQLLLLDAVAAARFLDTESSWSGARHHSWDPEGKAIVLLRREIEYVVGYQVQNQSDTNDDREHNEARAIVDCGEEGDQEEPKGQVVGLADERQRVSEALFDRNIVGCVFLEPCEPHGCVTLDDQSIHHPDNRETNHAPHFPP